MSCPPTQGACDLSLIIACYREEGHLEHSVREVLKTLESTDYSFELIFIEDHGGDNTPAIIEQIVQGDDRMTMVLHGENIGRGGTVVEGFRRARGRIVGFIDIDLEVHCKYIPAMLEAIDEGFDGATAHRRCPPDYWVGALLRRVLSHGYRVLSRAALDIPYADTEAGFKFFDRVRILPIVEETQHKGWFWDTEVMTLAHLSGLRIREIPCDFIRRKDKESTVRLLPDTLGYCKSLWAFRKRIKGLQQHLVGCSAD